MLSRFFIAGLLAFLLLGAGYGATQAARYTPWDCSDWQAFAHADRATSILESLAENRGKTIYCGIDQSDTFAKAETWEAGRDRNERDSTEYQGERGRFRGFIAAQEGWLTEGESGITGQSIAVIFEFPREEQRIKRTKRLKVPAHNSRTVHTEWAPHGWQSSSQSTRRQKAREEYNSANLDATTDWLAVGKEAATPYCRSEGYQRAVGVAVTMDAFSWQYREVIPSGNVPAEQARKARTWSATCLKVIRRIR